MAKSSSKSTKSHARSVVEAGTAVRDRVRDLSVHALRDRSLSGREVSKLVHDILDGTLEGVEPKSSGSVLRQVFDGMREGVNALASAAGETMDELRERGRNVVGKDSTRRVQEANRDFLDAVADFADRAGREVRQELNVLVDRARDTAPRVTGAARDAVDAASGRWTELAGETMRAGGRLARRGASTLAMGASGMLEGLGEALGGRTRSTGSAARTTRKTAAKRPPPRTTASRTTKKSSKRPAKKRSKR